MKKAHKITYWVATIWLSLGMLSTGIVQLLHLEADVTKIQHLGYPVYFLTLLGIWKILGVVAILSPRFVLVKEWAYAGFFFAMSGAVISHLAIHDPILEILPSVWLVVLTVVSWYFRPESRKMKTNIA